MYPVNSHGEIVNEPLPLRCNTKYYLGVMMGDKILTLKIAGGCLIFTEGPHNSDTIYFEVPPGHTLSTNDVQAKNFLKVGNDFLVDRISVKLRCVKFFISPYHNNVLVTPTTVTPTTVTPTTVTSTSMYAPTTVTSTSVSTTSMYAAPTTSTNTGMYQGMRYISKYNKNNDCGYDEPAVPNPNGHIVIVGPNCNGKKCIDDHGCGGLCGCSDGNVCNGNTGTCIPMSALPTNNCPDPTTVMCGTNGCQGICPAGQSCTMGSTGLFSCVSNNCPAPNTVACGTNNGVCQGTCPNGQTCTMGSTGLFSCVTNSIPITPVTPVNNTWWVWVVILVILLIILIAAGIYYYNYSVVTI